jgi:predicted DNA-binding protein with PD1-like motif
MSLQIEICHPGPAAPAPVQTAQGTAVTRTVRLEAGGILMQQVARVMEAEGCDSGVIVLDGMHMGPYRYVGPDRSTDGIHAAWYSEQRAGDAARIRQGTAIVGRRDGAWWLHAHALWDTEGGPPLAGHLLPDEVTLSETVEVTLHAFRGGVLDVSLNAETQFPIFHPTGGGRSGNAVLAKVNPHHDISTAIRQIATDAGLRSARIFGVGSLIGARFVNDAPAMISSISEVFVMQGARLEADSLDLPMFCVDPNGDHFQGPLSPGTSPVCVTFELMLIGDD